MSKHIHSNYFEDKYVKYECESCIRTFIVGEDLSRGMNLSCPYCGSKGLAETAASSDDSAEDMGCLGIYYHRYDDGRLMLYTEQEFADALMNALKLAGNEEIPLSAACEIITAYCSGRDGYGTA